MKKRLALPLAALLAAAMLAGCAPASVQSTKPNSATPTQSAPAECTHDWQYHFTSEEGHFEYGVTCYCGAVFQTAAEWDAHVARYDAPEAAANHGGNTFHSEWILDTPFSERWICSRCGLISAAPS